MNGGVLLVWRGATLVLIANEQIFWLFFFNSHVQNIHKKNIANCANLVKLERGSPIGFSGSGISFV